MSSNNSSDQVKAAVIGGIFVVIAACVTGIFLLANTVLERGIQAGNPVSEKDTDTPARDSSAIPSAISAGPTTDSSTYCCDWEHCWTFDDNARAMIWVGPGDGSCDISQAGVAMDRMRSGYTAFFVTTTPMYLEICLGQVDGVQISTGCYPKTLTIDPGAHHIVTHDTINGGFRVHP